MAQKHRDQLKEQLGTAPKFKRWEQCSPLKTGESKWHSPSHHGKAMMLPRNRRLLSSGQSRLLSIEGRLVQSHLFGWARRNHAKRLPIITRFGRCLSDSPSIGYSLYPPAPLPLKRKTPLIDLCKPPQSPKLRRGKFEQQNGCSSFFLSVDMQPKGSQSCHHPQTASNENSC